MNFLYRNRKQLFFTILILLFITVFTTNTFASGDVASAIENTWSDAKSQIKSVVNNVVFPVVDTILAILLFVKLGTCYFDYRKHGQFEWAAPAILFGCLIIASPAPTYIWSIIS